LQEVSVFILAVKVRIFYIKNLDASFDFSLTGNFHKI
jgi:hypothetical protein